MKRKYLVIMMAGLLTFGVVGVAKAMTVSMVAGPYTVAGPHPVSMEEWTNIVRSLQQSMECPDNTPDTPTNPFRFNLEENHNNLVEL